MIIILAISPNKHAKSNQSSNPPLSFSPSPI